MLLQCSIYLHKPRLLSLHSARQRTDLAARALKSRLVALILKDRSMKPLHLTLGAFAAAAAVLALGGWAPALAQKGGKNGAKTPETFSYEIRNGRRVPRGNRVASPDGSWKEEVKDGPCVTVREQTAPGEYREVRKCD
jgi:hypothetical protein